MRLDRLRIVLIGFLVILAVLEVLCAAADWTLWAPVLWACVPGTLLLRRARGAVVATAISVLAVLAIALAGLVVTAAVSAPIVPSFLVLAALLGLAGSWALLRVGAGPAPATGSTVAALAPALGAVTWAIVLGIARLHPGSAALSWVMNGDSANNLLFARVDLIQDGIRLGPSDNPVPLPAGLLAIGIAAGPDRTTHGALLGHDIVAFVGLWAVVIAAVCVLTGFVASALIPAARVALRVGVGAGASLVPLTWYVVGYPIEYGFLNTHVALLIVLACWLAYLRMSRSQPVLLVAALTLGCTLSLAVWSPLVLFPGLLLVAVVARRRTALFRSSRAERIVGVVGIVQLLVYAGAVTLPSFLAQSGFLAAGGGAYPFSKWVFIGLVVGSVVLAVVAWRIVGSDVGIGATAMVVASAAGWAALLFAARSTPSPVLSYYPLKFAWLAGVVLFLVAIGLAVGVVSSVSRRKVLSAVGIALIAVAAAAVVEIAPRNRTGYTVENPLARILSGDIIGRGDATAERIFRYADLNSPTLLVRSGESEEGEIDFWVLQMQANSVSGDATLRSAAYGVYDLGTTADLCTVLKKIDVPVVVLTKDPGLSDRLDARCPAERVDVRQIASP